MSEKFRDKISDNHELWSLETNSNDQNLPKEQSGTDFCL